MTVKSKMKEARVIAQYQIGPHQICRITVSPYGGYGKWLLLLTIGPYCLSNDYESEEKAMIAARGLATYLNRLFGGKKSA